MADITIIIFGDDVKDQMEVIFDNLCVGLPDWLSADAPLDVYVVTTDLNLPIPKEDFLLLHERVAVETPVDTEEKEDDGPREREGSKGTGDTSEERGSDEESRSESGAGEGSRGSTESEKGDGSESERSERSGETESKDN
jgi:hypothetical protein